MRILATGRGLVNVLLVRRRPGPAQLGGDGTSWLIRAGSHGEYEQKFIQEGRVYA